MGRRLETKVAEFLGWKNLQPDFSACRNFHLRLDWMLIPHYLCLWFCIEVEPDDVGWGCSRCPLAIEGHWVVLKGFHDMLEKSESLDARQGSQRVRFVVGTAGCIHGWPHLLCVDVEEIARENVGKLSQSEVTKRCAAEKCPLSSRVCPMRVWGRLMEKDSLAVFLSRAEEMERTLSPRCPRQGWKAGGTNLPLEILI